MFDETTFIVIIWVFLALAASSTLLRIVTQEDLISGSYDRILSYLSFLFLLSCSIVNTVQALTSFHLTHGYTTIKLTSAFLQLQFTSTILSTTCIWLSKASLLASYHALIDSNIPLRRAWFFILGTLIAAYVCSVMGYPFTSRDCDFGTTCISILCRY